MRPGFGYWIKLSEPDTLSYPESPLVTTPPANNGTASSSDPPAAVDRLSEETASFAPSTEWISLWGDEVRIGGILIDTGTLVMAIDNEGMLCGWCIAHHPGQFGLMPVYRDDPATVNDEGANPDEAFTVIVGDYVFEGFEWTGLGTVVNFNDVALLTGVEDRVPHKTVLHQNYPNPFNPVTNIAYEVAEHQAVTLTIFNTKGELVRMLKNTRQSPGRYSATWDGRNDGGQQVASGVYFYRLKVGAFTQTRKMVLLK
jgi:hypothetical protein